MGLFLFCRCSLISGKRGGLQLCHSWTRWPQSREEWTHTGSLMCQTSCWAFTLRSCLNYLVRWTWWWPEYTEAADLLSWDLWSDSKGQVLPLAVITHQNTVGTLGSAAFDSVALSFGSAAVGLQWVWLSYVCLAWSWHHSCSLIPPVHPIEVTWGYGVMAWMFIYAFPSLPSAAQIHM